MSNETYMKTRPDVKTDSLPSCAFRAGELRSLVVNFSLIYVITYINVFCLINPLVSFWSNLVKNDFP
jgi:hypothetical protein